MRATITMVMMSWMVSVREAASMTQSMMRLTSSIMAR